MDRNINVHLANPYAIKQYDGLKYRDDKVDANHLANLLRLGILPTGHIYPKEMRKVRDILRKRLFLVGQRTANILSFQSLIARCLGKNIKSNDIKNLSEYDLRKMFSEEEDRINVRANIRTVKFLSEQIKELEVAVKERVAFKEEYKNLLTVPGIGEILALTIILETGDIKRFNRVGNFVSYSRLVESKRISNEKTKGKGNSKSGNKYLCWAFVEAAATAINKYPDINRYYQKKEAKTNKVVARKTIAHKLARASYFIMKDNTVFDIERLFGPAKKVKEKGRQLTRIGDWLKNF